MRTAWRVWLQWGNILVELPCRMWTECFQKPVICFVTSSHSRLFTNLAMIVKIFCQLIESLRSLQRSWKLYQTSCLQHRCCCDWHQNWWSSENWVLDNYVLDRVRGQCEWVWQWHVCTEPIAWSVGYDDISFSFLFLGFITLYQGISWAKKKYHVYHDYEETFNKCRQLKKV